VEEPLVGDLVRERGGAPQNKGGRSLFIENPPLLLRSNFDIGFLLGLYLGLNVIGLNLRVDANFVSRHQLTK